MSRAKAFVQPMNSPPKQYIKEISHYGLYSPPSQRKTLIDQIINNCKLIEAPRIPLMQRPTNITLNNSTKQGYKEDKQNQKRISTHNPMEKVDSNRKGSNDKRNSMKKGSLQSTAYQTLPDWRSPRGGSEEYYLQSLAPKHNPVQPFQIPQQQLIHKASFSKRAIKLRSQIEKERQEHLTHCRQEQRKLSKYFMDLQMRLNQIKNQQLKTLTQYQAHKLNQLDECLKKAETETNEGEISTIQTIFEQICKCQVLKVQEDTSIEVKGCLRTNLNGMFFSFENLVLKEVKN